MAFQAEQWRMAALRGLAGSVARYSEVGLCAPHQHVQEYCAGRNPHICMLSILRQQRVHVFLYLLHMYSSERVGQQPECDPQLKTKHIRPGGMHLHGIQHTK